MILASNNFPKLVVSELQSGLAGIGLKKVSQNEFTMDLSSDTIGLVSFSIANIGSDVLSINTGIAVRHQPLEKLVAELSQQKFHPYRQGTISSNLGYVMPDQSYLTFAFSPHEQGVNGLVEMFDAVKAYGFTWMQQHRSLSEILIEIGKGYRFILRDAARLRLPVILLLRGRLQSSPRID